jgi:uncharacterized protein (TIGR03435 family)
VVTHSTPRALVYLATVLTLTAALTLPASAQLVHKGPAANIALSKTIPPYDVVSIRINKDGDEVSWGMHAGTDRFEATAVPLRTLIEYAYDVKPDLIVGLSGPVDSARFDIEAKVIPQDGSAPKLTDPQLIAMVIPLLADRFHLKAHIEQQTKPVYDLVVARGGPKIKLDPSERTGSSWQINADNDKTVLTIDRASMVDLANILADQVHRDVIDKTGLAGHADITLKWSDDVAAEQGGPDVISIFTAIEEQLGLRLQPSHGPVDTLVIDHAEMPTPD